MNSPQVRKDLEKDMVEFSPEYTKRYQQAAHPSWLLCHLLDACYAGVPSHSKTQLKTTLFQSDVKTLIEYCEKKIPEAHAWMINLHWLHTGGVCGSFRPAHPTFCRKGGKACILHARLASE